MLKFLKSTTLGVVLGAIVMILPSVAYTTEQAYQATVYLYAGDGNGTGIFISPTKILTAKHVAKEIDLKGVTPDGQKFRVIDHEDADTLDISILTVDTPYKGEVVPYGCKTINTLTNFAYYGNPLGLRFIGPFIIMPLRGTSYSTHAPKGLILFQGISLPGASGSGIIDTAGDVVGVLTTGLDAHRDDEDIMIPSGIGGFVPLEIPEACALVKKAVQ